MSKLDALLADAQGALAKNSRPSFSASEYDDAIIELAKRDKRDDESVAGACDRLTYVEKDDRVRALYGAARRAEALEPSRPSAEAVEKRGEREDAVLEHARKEARPGESAAAALDRLARERDPELRKLYGAAVA